MPTSTPALSLKEQLDGITSAIPEVIGSRIDAGVREIEASRAVPGLAVGDHAPNFTLPDALGRPVSLADLLAQGPVVVTFYRGEWCPYCNLQLHALQAVLPTIRELGASLVAISPQASDHGLSLIEKHELAFPVLSVHTKRVIESGRCTNLNGKTPEATISAMLAVCSKPGGPLHPHRQRHLHHRRPGRRWEPDGGARDNRDTDAHRQAGTPQTRSPTRPESKHRHLTPLPEPAPTPEMQPRESRPSQRLSRWFTPEPHDAPADQA